MNEYTLFRPRHDIEALLNTGKQLLGRRGYVGPFMKPLSCELLQNTKAMAHLHLHLLIPIR